MRGRKQVPILLALTAVLGGAARGESQRPTPLPLPGGDAGIGFDDLRYSPVLGKLLIPAGRTGNVDLIDPKTGHIEAIAGFSRAKSYGQGHGQSVTSVDFGGGLLFATDRTARRVVTIDPAGRTIVADVDLAGAPDYVRYVSPTREVWVTEPSGSRIEVFASAPGKPATLTHASFIDVPGGPESLVIDERRGRAYTHLWKSSTVAIELKSHKPAATWSAGCDSPRGIALDASRGFLLVGCDDGTATAMDVAHDGHVLSSVRSGRGVDIIAYDEKRSHLYLPGDESATMAIIAVSPAGRLTVLGTVPTVAGAHCVTSDGNGKAYVCDPARGRLLVVEDAYPPAGN
jgi:DNA-binding beta-propeller fold protein YncE